FQAGLPKGSSLRIAQDSRAGHALHRAGAAHAADDLAGGDDLRQQGHRDVPNLAELLVPLLGGQVHQHGAGGIRDVGDVLGALASLLGSGTATGTGRGTRAGGTGQLPDHPGVDRAEGQLSAFCALAGTVDVVQDPADFRRRKVRRRRQASAFLDELPLLLGERVDEVGGAGVLPNDGVVDRLAGGTVPDHRGFTLIGDTDGRDFLRGDVLGGSRVGDDAADVEPDLLRVVLHPARVREDLLVWQLAAARDLPATVENDAARGGRPLVDGEDESPTGVGQAGVLLSDLVGKLIRESVHRVRLRDLAIFPAAENCGHDEQCDTAAHADHRDPAEGIQRAAGLGGDVVLPLVARDVRALDVLGELHPGVHSLDLGERQGDVLDLDVFVGEVLQVLDLVVDGLA